MSELYCNIDYSYAKYNCGPSGDSNDAYSTGNNWNNSNGGGGDSPNRLGVYCGYAGWHSNSSTPGKFNWRSVIRFTVPTSLPTTARIDNLIISIPIRGDIEISYPYHSFAILLDRAPYDSKSNPTGVKPDELCGRESIAVAKRTGQGATKLRYGNLDSYINQDLRDFGTSYAHYLNRSENTYVRITERVTSKKTAYFVMSPDSLTPGKTYYIYFVRNGKCQSYSDCLYAGYPTHGVSGYMCSVISEGDASVKINYTNSVPFDIKATLNGGDAVSDFSEYGTIDFILDGATYTDKSAFRTEVIPGSKFKWTKYKSQSRYDIIDTSKLNREYTIQSGKVFTIPFVTMYELGFRNELMQVKYDYKLHSTTYIIPTYLQAFGKPVPEGYKFLGWKDKSGTASFTPGEICSNKLDMLADSNGTILLDVNLSPNQYNIYYKVDGIVVKTEPIKFGETFTVATYTGTDASSRVFSMWEYAGSSYYQGQEHTFNYPHDITLEAVFSSRTYIFKFVCGGEEVCSKSIPYGSDVTLYFPTSIPADKYGFNRYHKLDGWLLQNGPPTDYRWDNILTNSVDYTVTLNADIGYRYKPIVYKNGEWRKLVPIVSRETKWYKVFPYIKTK